MLRILRTDQSNLKGFRQVGAGDLSLLRDFEFNGRQELGRTLEAEVTPSINRVTGDLKVTLPSFVPKESIKAPEITTHFRLVVIGQELDFLSNTVIAKKTFSAYLPWDITATGAVTVTAAMTPNSTLPLVLSLGIELWQEVLGVKYHVLDNSFNACKIMAVDA